MAKRGAAMILTIAAQAHNVGIQTSDIRCKRIFGKERHNNNIWPPNTQWSIQFWQFFLLVYNIVCWLYEQFLNCFKLLQESGTLAFGWRLLIFLRLLKMKLSKHRSVHNPIILYSCLVVKSIRPVAVEVLLKSIYLLLSPTHEPHSGFENDVSKSSWAPCFMTS